MLSPEDLARYIARQHIEAELVHLPVETPTVPAAAAAVDAPEEQIGKSILFLVKGGEPVLVIASGPGRVDIRRLAGYLGLSRKRLRLAPAEEVEEILGYPVGTVPPFGHKREVRTILHAGILAQEEIYAGGGGSQALLRIRPAELQRVLEAEVAAL